MGRPSIGVAITTRARPGYLDDALASLAAQTRLPDEVIVSEDGADDDTAQVIERHRERGLPLTHVINVPALGIAENRRSALQALRSDFVAMLDDDDAYEPTFLERSGEALTENADCGFVTAAQSVMSPDGDILVEDSRLHAERFGRDRLSTGVVRNVLELELEYKAFPIQTTLIRRETFEQTSFFREGRGLDDFQLFLELGALRVDGYYIAEELGRYRDHPGSGTINNMLQLALEVDAGLRFTREHFELSASERQAIAASFRANVLEIAIAYARAGQRRSAFRTLRTMGDLGWGAPSVRRLAVFAAASLGVREAPFAAKRDA